MPRRNWTPEALLAAYRTLCPGDKRIFAALYVNEPDCPLHHGYQHAMDVTRALFPALATAKGNLSRKTDENVQEDERQRELELRGLPDREIAEELHSSLGAIYARRKREGRRKLKPPE